MSKSERWIRLEDIQGIDRAELPSRFSGLEQVRVTLKDSAPPPKVKSPRAAKDDDRVSPVSDPNAQGDFRIDDLWFNKGEPQIVERSRVGSATFNKVLLSSWLVHDVPEGTKGA